MLHARSVQIRPRGRCLLRHRPPPHDVTISVMYATLACISTSVGLVLLPWHLESNSLVHLALGFSGAAQRIVRSVLLSDSAPRAMPNHAFFAVMRWADNWNLMRPSEIA